MKGILLKNLYSIRTSLILGLLLVLIFFAAMFILGIPAEIIPLIIVLYDYLAIAVLSSFILNSFSDDEKSGWIRLERTVPISAERAAAVRFISCGVVVGVICAAMLIINIAVYFYCAQMSNVAPSIEVMLSAPVVAGLIQLAALSPVVPIGLRYGSRMVQTVYTLCVILVSIAAVAFSFPLAAGEIPPSKLRLICYAGVPAAAAAVVLLSYLFAKKSVKRDL